jgi:hypothetical protein
MYSCLQFKSEGFEQVVKTHVFQATQRNLQGIPPPELRKEIPSLGDMLWEGSTYPNHCRGEILEGVY